MQIHWKPLQIAGSYDYDPQQLKEEWQRLHLCQSEPFPAPDYLKGLCERNPAVKRSIPGFKDDYHQLSEQLLDAWRDFHAGRFESAYQKGKSLGYIGYLVAHMSTCVYASNVQDDKQILKEIYLNSAGESLKASQVMPEHTNSTYFYGLHIGRYSETVSLLKAATENIAPKFLNALTVTLSANNDHVLANIGLGTFHASVIDTVGSLVAKLTYKASRENAFKHFEKGMQVAPQLPVVYIEYSKGLKILEGKKGQLEAKKLLEKASKLPPVDAMEALDIQWCLRELA